MWISASTVTVAFIIEYFDLNEEISEMFPESSDVLIQVKEAFNSHFKLKLRQVGEGIVQDLRHKILDEDDVGGRQSFWCSDYRRRRV